MLKKRISLILSSVLMTFYAGFCFAETESLVIMGSVIDAVDESPISRARLIFRIDTLRFHQRLTDDFGFFMINLPGINEGKILKYFVLHENYLTEKRAYVIQAVNDPLTIALQKDTSGESKQQLKIEGCIKSIDDELPIESARLKLRIGEVILPDTLTDENGRFSIPLVPDDLGKVVTYQILKDGYSPRYGYTTVERENEFIDIQLQKWLLTVSGYIKDAKNRKPIAAARVFVDADSMEPVVKFTSQWGFFTHTFEQLKMGQPLKMRVEKRGYQSHEAELYPQDEQKIQFNVNLERLSTGPPFYKNRIFWYGSAGVAVITTSIILITRIGGDEPEPKDLPMPPIPPDN